MIHQGQELELKGVTINKNIILGIQIYNNEDIQKNENENENKYNSNIKDEDNKEEFYQDEMEIDENKGVINPKDENEEE